MLAVVDPGVGTARRARSRSRSPTAPACSSGRTTGCSPRRSPIAGGAERAVELTNPEYQLAAPGATFAGRDVFAPAAAHLCNGVDLADLGPAVDAADADAGHGPAAARRRRRHPRRGAVGRPVRQLPAQRRPRRSRRRVDVPDVWAVTIGDERRVARSGGVLRRARHRRRRARPRLPRDVQRWRSTSVGRRRARPRRGRRGRARPAGRRRAVQPA